MSWSWHCTVPLPALVHRIVVPHTSHRYRLPSWFAIESPAAYAFFTAGLLQHLSVPSPPLVTTNCDPQFEHEYRFPVSFAKGILLSN